MIENVANALSILAAAAAGVFWFLSTTSSVPPEPGSDPLGEGTAISKTIITSMGGKRIDLLKTMIRQSRQNAIAAAFACTAAIGQVVALAAKMLAWP